MCGFEEVVLDAIFHTCTTPCCHQQPHTAHCKQQTPFSAFVSDPLAHAAPGGGTAGPDFGLGSESVKWSDRWAQREADEADDAGGQKSYKAQQYGQQI